MLLQKGNILIRNAETEDAVVLARWWNDGAVMAHAGFPNGSGQTADEIARSIATDTDGTHRRLIIEIDGTPVGEMNYRNLGNATAIIGIKICDFSKQDKGYGRIILSMLFASLFEDYQYKTIVSDTNTKNTRSQHVHEMLGFRRLRVEENSWRDQLGELQSRVVYEMSQEDFINHAT